MTTPTIAAIATGSSPGGIGIVRLSGPAALPAARSVATRLSSTPEPRRATLTDFVDATGAVLDQGLTLYFPGPHSFTGEDVVELHAHGSPRLLQLLLERVAAFPSVRLAEPGEFTRRAFVNGRLDLARAEAVADLVSAESEAAVRAAAAQLTGELSRRVEAIRAPLVELGADVEGVLQFPDEAEAAEVDAAGRFDAALGALKGLVQAGARGALLRRRRRIVLYGPVNAGKSTLFNALVGAERALVDTEPGTTRDVLEAVVDLDGVPVTLVDTAGLRDDAGRVERLGIERAREAVRGADLALLVIPPGATEDELRAWRFEADQRISVEVWAKADLRSTWNGPAGSALPSGSEGLWSGEAGGDGGRAPLEVSARTGHGLGALREHLLSRLGAGETEGALMTSERALAALRSALEALTRGRAALDVSTLEVAAGELQLALGALDGLTGQEASADVLDAIFRRFCIGK